jgi:ubiquinone/menaquinone biosynthesis C-methylase UbiE
MSLENPSKTKESQERTDISETHIYPSMNRRLQDRYDRIAPQWNSDAYEGTRRDDLIPKLCELLSLDKDGLRVLEAMSGTARLSAEVLAKYPTHDVYALDFSLGMLNQVPTGIKKIQSSIIATPFANGTFDRLIIRNALYDLPRRQQQAALGEIRRILSDDGIFVLQHYVTDTDTFEYLNQLVKMKDVAGNQNEDMGEERFPRYFAPQAEFEEWLSAAGLSATVEETFQGPIRYQKTSEMVDANVWKDYALNLPEEIKNKIDMRTEDDGTITFNFPGVIYRITKSA